MLKKIYIITFGEYSDYEIEKSFSQKEDEEYPLVSVGIKKSNNTQYYSCTDVKQQTHKDIIQGFRRHYTQSLFERGEYE